MTTILITVAAIFIAALALHLYKQMNLRTEGRQRENEYNAAVLLWTYAREVRGQIDQATRRGAGVLDFTNLSVPHSQGYNVSIELTGARFRVYAAPIRHGRSGKLSFFTDNSLTVRAADHGGEQGACAAV